MKKHILDYRHDSDADAIYFRLADKPYAYGEDLDHERRIDYAEDRSPIGIELLAVSSGVELAGLPFENEIAAVLEIEGVPVYA